MSKKANHPDFPDKATLLEYLKGGLSFSERHRIEKLMHEHDFFREVVEGLETEYPEQVEKDLADLSYAIRSRSGIFTSFSFNFYRLAATISLIVMTSVIVYVLIDWIKEPGSEQKLSLNQTISKEQVDTRDKEDTGNQAGVPVNESTIPIQDSDPQEQNRLNITEKQSDQSERQKIAGVIEEPDVTESNEEVSLTLSLQAAKPEKQEEIAAIRSPESLRETIAFTKDTLAESDRTKVTNNREDHMAAAAPLEYEKEEDAAKKRIESTPALRSISTPSRSQAQPTIGFKAFLKYLENELQYPLEALENQVEGVVILDFVIGSDSIPNKFSVVHSLGYGCDEEALRLIREGPKWIPARVEGNTVETTTEIEVKFILPDK